jgi:hypothetical protein
MDGGIVVVVVVANQKTRRKSQLSDQVIVLDQELLTDPSAH